MQAGRSSLLLFPYDFTGLQYLAKAHTKGPFHNVSFQALPVFKVGWGTVQLFQSILMVLCGHQYQFFLQWIIPLILKSQTRCVHSTDIASTSSDKFYICSSLSWVAIYSRYVVSIRKPMAASYKIWSTHIFTIQNTRWGQSCPICFFKPSL